MARAFPQVPTDSRPLRQAQRRVRSSSAIGECAADERGGNFPARKALKKLSKTRKELLWGNRAAPCTGRSGLARARKLPFKGLEKIESAPGYGRVSEVSSPQKM